MADRIKRLEYLCYWKYRYDMNKLIYTKSGDNGIVPDSAVVETVAENPTASPYYYGR